jgi:hypothetical protein
VTEASENKRRWIASMICAGNVIFIMLFQPFNGIAANSGPFSFRFISYLTLSVLGYVYLYIHSDKDKRFGLLMLPITLIIIAIFSYLTKSPFN